MRHESRWLLWILAVGLPASAPGFKDVKRFPGEIFAWMGAGYPTEGSP